MTAMMPLSGTCRSIMRCGICRSPLTLGRTGPVQQCTGFLGTALPLRPPTHLPTPIVKQRSMNTMPGRRFHVVAASSMVDAIKQKNEENPVIVYATTYCPFCAGVKGLFDKLGVPYKAVDVDTIVEGDDIRDALAELTQSHTVPQVFIGGEFIGGCDDTMQLNSSGKLAEKLEAVGVAAKA